MRQVRIQKRNKRLVTIVGAAIAASALLSAFQPASADPVPNVKVGPVPGIGTSATVVVPIVNSGSANTYAVQQGDFEIRVYVDEGSAWLCAVIRYRLGEEHRGCASGADVDVSDTLDSAWGRGTNDWSTSVQGKGRSKTTYKYGTLAIDVSWTGTGDTITHLEPPDCYWVELSYDGGGCGGVHFWQSRTATWSGTITDSEWGTFVVNGAPGWLQQDAMPF